MTCPANDMCDKENAFSWVNWGLLLVYCFHSCAGTTTGITSPRTGRRLTLPRAMYKAGREVLAFALTQLAWNVRHFHVAEGSTSTSTAGISQRTAVVFAQRLCQAAAEGRNRALCFSPVIFNKRISGSSHKKKESSTTAHCSVKANANF